jgi:hypothetical protein
MTLLNSVVLSQSKFSLGLFFAPEYSYISNVPIDKANLKPTYSSGFNIRYQLSKKIILSTGLQFSNKGYTARTTVIANQNNNIEEATKITLSYRYFEIPAVISCQLVMPQDFLIIPSVGLIPGYLMNQRFSIAPIDKFPGGYFVNNRSDLNSIGYRKFILSGYVGVGGMIKMGKKFSLLIQPNFKYSLTSMHKIHSENSVYSPYSYNMHPYSFGITAEVFYHF